MKQRNKRKEQVWNYDETGKELGQNTAETGQIREVNEKAYKKVGNYDETGKKRVAYKDLGRNWELICMQKGSRVKQ